MSTGTKCQRRELRQIRVWLHEHEAAWTDDDIESCAWLMAHTEATITCNLDHPDFARAFYRYNIMKGVSRAKTLIGMAHDFPPGTVDYVMKTER